MLRLEGVTVGYRPGVPVLHQVSLEVQAGEMVTLIGGNGAGKSTTLRTILGILHPWQGSVRFQDADVTRTHTTDLVQAGIAVVPEGRRLFPTLNVTENLLVGAYSRWDRGVRERLAQVMELFPRLPHLAGRAAGSLSGGEQQMVAIGRALMAAPKLLLLDEPSMGLAPVVVEEIFDRFRLLREQGMTLLVVEQNAFLALETADRGYVLERGRIVLAGTSADLLADPSVQRAYLGV